MNKSTEPKPRYTETWFAAVMADVGLHLRAKAAAYVLAQHADWTTGADAYPSAPTIARAAGIPLRTVRRALEDLEDAGWVARTGIMRMRNATDYRLIMASSATHGTTEADSVMPPTARLEAFSSATHGTTADVPVVPLSTPVVPPEVASSAVGGTQTPHTSSDRREDEGGGAHSLTRPEGSTLIALATDAAAEILAAVLPDRAPWTDGINAADPKLLAVLADWAAAGRDVDALRDVCANLGKPKSDPTRLLVAHIGRAVSEPIPRLVRPSVTAGQGQDTQPAATKTQKPKKPKTGEPPTIPAEFGDYAPSICAELVEEGADISVAGDGIEAAGKGWRVAWRVGGRPELTTADARIRVAVLDEVIGSSDNGNVIQCGEDAMAFYNLADAALRGEVA